MPASVLSVRVSEAERDLLEAAELAMLERPVITIPAEDREAFELWANRPPQTIAALEELARTVPQLRT